MTACASFPAHAQAHETRAGAYVVGASAVDSERFDAASARANGIDPAPTRGILNVTLLHLEGRRRRNVRGEVRASVADLTGRRLQHRDAAGGRRPHGVDARRLRAHARQVLDFRIVAKPEGAAAPITLRFRDRIWVPEDASH